MLARAAILLLSLPFLAGAAKRLVTLDDVTATRAPISGSGAITWAPDGKRFAFRERNSIWQYDVRSGLKKEIVSLATLRGKAVKPATNLGFDWQNRRVSEASYQWSSSGDEMLVATNGDLFLVPLAGGGARQLTATAEPERDPKLSPDGRSVTFRRGHDLYALDIASLKETRLTRDGSSTLLNGQLDWVYPEELDLSTAYWWSPDSTRIAYLQFDISREPEFPQADLLRTRAVFEPERYPQPGDPNADVRVGVVLAAGGPTRWMDLGETRDFLIARVNWLPGGRSLAVQRLNRVQNRLDLLLADPATGASSLLLREQDPYWVDVADTYRFLEDGKRLLWSSSREGYRHFYLYSIDGKLLHTITRGDWEVTDLAGVDESSKTIYYVSTAQSPLERHLYRVGFDGKHAARLTETPGTHTISMSPTCDFYLDSESSLAAPRRRTLHAKDGTPVAVYMERDSTLTDEVQFQPQEIVKVSATDGTLLYGSLIKPAGFTPGKKYPAIVMVYGGPHSQTVRDSWSGANWNQALAARGFVIWQLDNRGSSGRGHRWESAVYHNLGAKELEDQKDGIRYLESLGFVDPTRVGIYGWSYGGFMTLNALFNAPSLFRAGIAGAPVVDWRNYDTIYTERYMGLPAENEQGYRSSSLIEKAGALTAKLLIVHNFSDDNVHFQNSVQIADALERAGKQFEMRVYTQKTHAVSGPAYKHMLEGLTEYFEKNLK
jgi:dipeptidyl-peptidase-4